MLGALLGRFFLDPTNIGHWQALERTCAKRRVVDDCWAPGNGDAARQAWPRLALTYPVLLQGPSYPSVLVNDFHLAVQTRPDDLSVTFARRPRVCPACS